MCLLIVLCVSCAPFARVRCSLAAKVFSLKERAACYVDRMAALCIKRQL